MSNSKKTSQKDIINLVKQLSNNYTQIISREEIRKHPIIDWGDNGIGDRFARKLFNYTVISKNKTQTYSETDDEINDKLLNDFRDKCNIKTNSIIGILIHNEKTKKINRPISNKIREHYKNSSCVVCGSNSDITIDHKNDLYDDEKVLNIQTQTVDDFQTLCNHCNLQKRQVCKREKQIKQFYSAKNIPMLNVFDDIISQIENGTKENCFWYDPVKFMLKIKKIYEEENKELKEEINKLKDENKELKEQLKDENKELKEQLKEEIKN